MPENYGWYLRTGLVSVNKLTYSRLLVSILHTIATWWDGIYMAKAVAEQGSGMLFMELATVTVIYYTWAFICGCRSYRYTDQSFTSAVHNAASYLVVWFMPVLIILSVQMSMTNVLASIIVGLSRWYSVNLELLHAYLLRVPKDNVSIISEDWLHFLDFSRTFSDNLRKEWMESTVRVNNQFFFLFCWCWLC